jgi:hypothetical protein
MRAAGDWQKDSLCRKENPEDYFTGQGQNPTDARKVCPRCPVRQECLDYAIMYGEKGFWGGLTERERSKLPAVGFIRRTLILEAKSLGLYEDRPSIETLIEEARRAGVYEFARPEVPLDELEPPEELLMAERDPNESVLPPSDLPVDQYPATA